MDSKKLLCFALLASVTSLSHASGFFVNTSLGETNFYPQSNVYDFYGHSHTEALRVGYRWTSGAFSYGLETGYANLGHSHQYYGHLIGFTNLSERIDGPVLGANLKYSLPMGFYVSARGGFFRSTDHQISKETSWSFFPYPQTTYTTSANVSGMGSYFGVGIGYDISKSFGVGLNYDRYRAHVVTNYQEILFDVTPRVDAYTLTAEYRF
ncbi:hypothetical protein EKH79_07680 [Dyella dinghuensis]|uniref:Outer membrane protein beta-barrel domain-containing protein n=1 Tax=Dyella dinghuensis TaxID=1920169 RepID=A0A432LSL0_9GAMM|nr:outer membrane beta-barrel protein [Dyella dinghuensis]RUL63941.1 hypothetical protein EKH79_07680 [Dyella dinghuensis]